MKITTKLYKKHKILLILLLKALIYGEFSSHKTLEIKTNKIENNQFLKKEICPLVTFYFYFHIINNNA